MSDDLLSEIEREWSAPTSTSNEEKAAPFTSKEGLARDEGGNIDLLPLVVELIHRVQNTLSGTRNFAQLSRGRFSDREFGDYFDRVVSGDLDQIDLALTGLLNYIKVNTPIQKRNTVHTLIEEVWKAHRPGLEEKKVRLFKRFEKDLPETIVPDEQLRYMLDSLVRYAMAAGLSDGSVGISTKSAALRREGVETRPGLDPSRRYIQIIMVFEATKKPAEPPLETGFAPHALRREDLLDLEMRMVREMVRKNQGVIKVETDEKRSRTLIILRFPVERRKVVYYRALNQ